MKDSHQEPAECTQGYPACLGRLASIETKLDSLVSQAKDNELRLRTLEDERSQAKGGAKVLHAVSIIIGGVAGALASWLVGFFKHP